MNTVGGRRARTRVGDALRRLLVAVAVLGGLAFVAGPSLDAASGPGGHLVASGAVLASVLSGSALTAVLAGALAAAAVVLVLLGVAPRPPAVLRWDADVAVVLDDQPGRPGRARPRAPGAGSTPRRLAA